MDVLGMLKQEPGAVKGLLTSSADVAGRLVFICRQRKTTFLLELLLGYLQRLCGW